MYLLSLNFIYHMLLKTLFSYKLAWLLIYFVLYLLSLYFFLYIMYQMSHIYKIWCFCFMKFLPFPPHDYWNNPHTVMWMDHEQKLAVVNSGGWGWAWGPTALYHLPSSQPGDRRGFLLTLEADFQKFNLGLDLGPFWGFWCSSRRGHTLTFQWIWKCQASTIISTTDSFER